MKRPIYIALLLQVASVLANADIKLGDFSKTTDGWELIGDSAFPEDRKLERVEDGGLGWLKLSYYPFETDPDTYRGWAGLGKLWDNSGQKDVQTLSFQIASNRPWKTNVLARFEKSDGETFEKLGGQVYWPNGTIELTAESFDVSADEFNTIRGLRFTLDNESATNGGSRNNQEAISLEISDIRLDGKIDPTLMTPSTATSPLFALGDFNGDPLDEWSIRGDSNHLASFQLDVLDEGKGSKMALRLNKTGREGWCGMGITINEMLPQDSKGIQLWVRRVKGVKQIILDVHGGKDERWWCVVPLSEEGTWKKVRVSWSDFSGVNGTAGIPSPENITSLWINMGETEGEDDFSFDVAEVGLWGSGKGKQSMTFLIPPAPLKENTRVLIVVSDAPNQPSGWPDAFLRACRLAGADAQVLPVDTAETALSESAGTVLVINEREVLIRLLSSVTNHLAKGGALWLLGQDDFYSRTVTGEQGPFFASGVIGRLLEGPPQNRTLAQLEKPSFVVTEAGKEIFGEINSIPATSCSFLATNDSIFAPTLPPWVVAVPWLQAYYRQKNWVQQDDVFTGSVMTLLEHRGGPWKGARILFSGLPWGKGVFKPDDSKTLNQLVAHSIGKLAQPIPELLQKPPFEQTERPVVTRANFLLDGTDAFAPLCFGPYDFESPEFWEDMRLAGFNAIHTNISWISEAKTPESAIDWTKLDTVFAEAGKRGIGVILDPWDFHWAGFAWTGNQTQHNPEFVRRYMATLAAVAKRYKDNPSWVAIAATPTTGFGEFEFDEKPETLIAWREFLQNEKNFTISDINQRYGLEIKDWSQLTVPKVKSGKESRFNVGAMWSDYVEFRVGGVQQFLVNAIETIREEVPDMPILLRGGFHGLAITAEVAARFSNVAPHSECVETSADTDAFFRGYSLRYGVPIGAENGWPKSKGGPLDMALANYLLGGYSFFLYSFGGPQQARPSVDRLRQTYLISASLKGARPSRSDLGLLISDTTMFSSCPPSFLSMEGKGLQLTMERLGFPFEAVSAHFPKLEGIRVLIDDGQNFVLTADARDQLVAWVKAGGTLIAFPETGGLIQDGSSRTLAESLGISLTPEKGQGLKENKVGAGKVIVLAARPSEKNSLAVQNLDDILAKCEIKRDFLVSPHVNQVALRGEEKTFLVLAAKSREYIGTYFSESRLAAQEAKMAATPVTVVPQFSFSTVYDVSTGSQLSHESGKIKAVVPKTGQLVLAFIRTHSSTLSAETTPVE